MQHSRPGAPQVSVRPRWVTGVLGPVAVALTCTFLCRKARGRRPGRGGTPAVLDMTRYAHQHPDLRRTGEHRMAKQLKEAASVATLQQARTDVREVVEAVIADVRRRG